MRRQLEEIITRAVGDPSEVSVPESVAHGHYSTNVAMRLARETRRPPLELAAELKTKIADAAPAGFLEKIEVVSPGFLNFWISPSAIRESFFSAVRGEHLAPLTAGAGKKIIAEYSQPNIAKRMHVGHVRTTIIGDMLANAYQQMGYEVVRWNYLGDWGTQFGKLIVAFRKWGDRAKVAANPIEELQALYVKFHDEVKNNASLEDEARAEFKKLESGDAANRDLWEWFKEESLKEFNKIYALLGVKFDVWIGEAFFEGEMQATVRDLLERDIAKESEGAVIVPLEDKHLPPALLRKSDGASLYLTRDIANLKYRIANYAPAKIFYVVGNEQTLHFQQLFAVAEMLGLNGSELIHVKYGLVLAESGKKFSTREGRVTLLEEVLQEAVSRAEEIVVGKNPDLDPARRAEVARAVGIGAVKYGILKENRNSDIVFDWDRMLDTTGESGPYLQYTYARLRSILRKAGDSTGSERSDYAGLAAEPELALVRKMFDLPFAVRIAAEQYAPNALCLYGYELAVLANRFYESELILKDENENRRRDRLALVQAAAETLKKVLAILGIAAPEEI